MLKYMRLSVLTNLTKCLFSITFLQTTMFPNISVVLDRATLCTNQIYLLFDNIHEAFDDKENLKLRSIYLDMSKAYEKVSHDGIT